MLPSSATYAGDSSSGLVPAMDDEQKSHDELDITTTTEDNTQPSTPASKQPTAKAPSVDSIEVGTGGDSTAASTHLGAAGTDSSVAAASAAAVQAAAPSSSVAKSMQDEDFVGEILARAIENLKVSSTV